MKQPAPIQTTAIARRAFLGGVTRGGLAGGCAALSPGWTIPVWAFGLGPEPLASAPKVFMLEHASLAIFAAQVGTAFRLDAGAGWAGEIKLVEATRLGRGGMPASEGAGAREPFSLIFEAPAGLELEQRIYTLHHAQLGRVELFLVPIGRTADGLRCEAVFG